MHKNKLLSKFKKPFLIYFSFKISLNEGITFDSRLHILAPIKTNIAVESRSEIL
jgi:hypothetical protein